MNLENLRSTLKEELQQYPVLFAYVFGSQATGRTHPESDIDLGMFLEGSIRPEQRHALRLKLLGMLSRILKTDKVDLVILNEAPPLLAYEVLRTGLLVYCSNENARVEFQVRTLQAYEETIPLRRILSEAMAERLKTGAFGKPVLKRVG